MKVDELTNLYVGHNKVENFRVLICALDVEKAQRIVNEYCLDSHMEGKFEITEFDNKEVQFDCDYVLTGGY